MRNVYFTSFHQSHQLPSGVWVCSAAVYQPKGYNYPKVDWTDIRQDGHWIRPRDFIDQPEPLRAYREALWSLYLSRFAEAQQWAAALPGDVALCCWCPHDQAAQRQLREFGSFVCHTAVLSEFCYERLGLQVWEDGERRRMAVLPK